MLNWLMQITPGEVLMWIVGSAWGLVQLGEWKRRVEARRCPPNGYVTKKDLEIQSMNDRTEARHFARNLVQEAMNNCVTKDIHEAAYTRLRERVERLEARRR